MKKSLRIFLVLFLTSVFDVEPSCALDQPCLKVGANVPLTGFLANYGASIQEGVTMALDESPEKGRVTFDWQDNKSEAKETVSIFKKQSAENVDLFVTAVKPQFMSIAKDLETLGSPNFAWVFDIDLRANGNNHFRTWVNFRAEPKLFAEYAVERKATKIAIIYVQLPHTTEVYEEKLIPLLRSKGLNEIKVEPYQFDLKDFKSMVLRLRRYNPDFLIVSGFKENLLTLIPVLNQYKLINGANTVFSYDLLEALPQLPAGMVEGVRGMSPSFILDQSDGSYPSWRKRFEERFKKKADYTHAYAFDMANIIIDASKRICVGEGKSEIHQAIAETNIAGVTGPLKFDDMGDLVSSLNQVELGIVENGKMNHVTNSRK